MLYAFILGIGLLVGLAFLIPWLTQVEPRAILRVLKWMAFGGLALAFLGLLLTGRLGWALAALAGLLPGLLKLARVLFFGRILHQAFGNPFGNPFRGMGGGSRGSGDVSEVTSRFLRMRLDLGSGAMEGRVIAGRFAGRPLDSLTMEEARALRQEVAEDADSLRLLETWLDRTHPGWDAEEARAEGAPSGDPMDRAEALRVLGLEDGADAEAVRAAYRKLMAQVHPDHGGSAWMAAKINQARDVLLGGAG